ncbi:MAG: YdeI/OmpD-associated family protein [Acidobacteriota bacterium]
MGSRDPRIDEYIARSAGFAKPILEYLREIVHTACPEVEETMKWSFPHFDYKGVLCSMAAFKSHCAFGFWKGSLVLEEKSRSDDAMGQMGRITSIDDLPPRRELLRLVKEAAKLNEQGVKVARKSVRGAKPELEVPSDLARALAANRPARAAFDKVPPSHRREYIEWIIDAKGEATRQRRLQQAVEWIAEGKSRNWKYERK